MSWRVCTPPDYRTRPIPFVRHAPNAITIASTDLRPQDVRAAIADALSRRALHRLHHIDVALDGAHATLRGDVQTEAERTAILGALAHAPGVAGVVCDELRVSTRRSTDAS